MTPRSNTAALRFALAATTAALIAIPVQAQDAVRTRDIRIDAIPLALHTAVAADKLTATSDTLTLQAPHGTDLFASFDGRDTADNTARALFQPQGDFILSARVAAGFGKQYDGGALVVYADRTHWAKLLFEKSKVTGAGVVTSTVANGAGDDAQHVRVDGDAVYLKIARVKDMVVFYSSVDGKSWTMDRTFGFPSTLPLQVGFSAQSPESDSYTARFSQIRYRPVAFKDYWQGE
jgi:regulation of enolase protein 1 (concanavalin A-like superfamily)